MHFLSRLSFRMVVGLSILALGAVGCGGSSSSSSGTSRATFILSNDSAGSRSAGEVRGVVEDGPIPAEEIASLRLTITEIELQRCDGDDDPDDGLEVILVRNFEFDPTSVTVEEGDLVRWLWEEDGEHTVTGGAPGDIDMEMPFHGEGAVAGDVFEAFFDEVGVFPYFSDNEMDVSEGMAGLVEVVPDDDSRASRGVIEESGGHVVVYEGAFEVELTDLAALSEVLSTEDIPSGEYCKIRIRIEDPRLLFVDDPVDMEPRTNVQLTANGRLFIKVGLDLAPNQEYLIVLNFGGIHLVDAGASGKYVLTPQLRATVEVSDAATSVEGNLTLVDCPAGILLVETDEGDIFEIMLDETTVFEDSNAVPLLCEELELGQRVVVDGLLTLGGIVEAGTVEVQVPAP